jgi:hypothetical protein
VDSIANTFINQEENDEKKGTRTHLVPDNNDPISPD